MERKIIEKLIQWKNKAARKPLILKGARQVGKTYILKWFGKENFPSVHYLNFEKDNQLATLFEKDLNPKRILQEISFYLNTSIQENNDLIIFDEIQNVPRALTSLKYFQEEIPQLAICSAGSLLGLQLSDESFPVGKVEFLEMYPMSFEEFLMGIGDIKSFEFLCDLRSKETIPDLIHQHLWEQLKIYFVVGGLPEVVKTFNEQRDNLFTALSNVREKQDNLITTYVADMAKHSGKKNAMHIERLWRNIPAQLARMIDGSAPKFKFKDIIPGIKRYAGLVDAIDWLVTTGLVIKVPVVNSAQLPLSAYAQENSFKLYVFDVGILGALSQMTPKIILDYTYGTYKGYFAENFAAQEFRGENAKNFYCWREGTSEVEFLKEINGDLFPIEIKSGWVTQSNSLKVFAQKYKPKHKTILSARNLAIDQPHGMYGYPLYTAGRFPLF